MKTLILMRHAMSGWNGIDADHKRPLSSSGHKEAQAIGKWLEAADIRPEMIISSDAKRTQQTTEILKPELSQEPEISFESTLYLASSAKIFRNLQGCDPAINTIMIVAHNPGIHDAALRTSRDEDHSELWNYPPAATTVFNLNEWEDAGKHLALLKHFITPKLLSV